MTSDDLIRTVSTAELEERAASLAKELDLPSAEAAFALLDRGDLDGTWAEVELKLVRHLRGEGPQSMPPLAAE